MVVCKELWLDFLLCFIDLCNCEGGEVVKFVFIDKVLCDMIFNFVIVGCDIIVVMLCWFFYMMMCYFEVVYKIVDEFVIVVM